MHSYKLIFSCGVSLWRHSHRYKIDIDIEYYYTADMSPHEIIHILESSLTGWKIFTYSPVYRMLQVEVNHPTTQ